MVHASVAGLGNVLMGDDAFGPTVVQTLEARYELDPEISVLDLGTPGLSLTPYVTGIDALIIVDSVWAPGRPGELHGYRREDILRHSRGPRISPHDPGLEEALLQAELLGCGPRDVLLLGIIPDRVEARVGLSPAVARGVSPAVDLVINELLRLGVPVGERTDPREPDLWWEVEVAGAGSPEDRRGG